MPDTRVVQTHHDGICLLTVDSQETRNALSRRVQAGIRAALERAAHDDAARAVVLTGSGERTFAAGADVGELREYGATDALAGHLQGLCEDIEQFPKPTVAAINGLALGGGCELAMACDVRVAARTARFGMPETGLSLVPGAGGTHRLTRLVGAGHALELILTGRRVDAEEARTLGLVTHVVEPEELLGRAFDVATAIAEKGPLATRLARLLVRTSAYGSKESAQIMERLAQAVLHQSADKVEGISAMLERRVPSYKGE